VVSLLLVAAVLTGCGDDGEEAATTTTTRPKATTTTDPFAVPDRIDAAYVQRVLTEHERVLGDAFRLAMQEGEVTQGVEERVRAIHAERPAAAELDDMRAAAAEGFPNARRGRGDRLVDQVALTHAAPDCIGVTARYLFDEVLEEPVDPVAVVIELRELPEGTDPVGYNRTGWLEVYQYAANRGEVPDPCSG
jgi:hypothetical protein